MKKISILFLYCFFVLDFRRSIRTGRVILTQMRTAAKELLIENLYPRNIDTAYGGYLSSFTYDFKPYRRPG